MPNIITPVALWSSFDDTLDVFPEILSAVDEDDIRLEKLYFQGRQTENGRVKIAAAYARSLSNPAAETVILLPDSKDTIDFGLIKYFVKQGYSVLMVDYRGIWDNCDFYTVYPECISYANLQIGRAHV